MVVGVFGIILLTGATICVSALFVIGLVQGMKEPVNLEELCAGETSLPENRIQHIDQWGTWTGYSVEVSDGEMHHYDAFGMQIGSRKRV